MKIEKVIIENFRGFSTATEIPFGNLNVFIGKNDVGKSTILEALDIFFNNSKGAVKIDSGDRNVDCSEIDEVSITVSFSNFPLEIDIDAGNKTTFANEKLLNSDGFLHIKKKYTGTGMKASAYIVADHPNSILGKDLLSKKNTDLQKIVKENNWEGDCVNMKINAELRQTIWRNCGELDMKETEIPMDKEDARDFLSKIEMHFPAYSLFRVDRENKETDDEAQDPMKAAVREVLKKYNLPAKLEAIAKTVSEEIEKIAAETLKKLREMNPEIADTLISRIPQSDKLKWAEVFTKDIGIYSDKDIPLDKRGSGVKRLVLLNFFRAQAEKLQASQAKSRIVYAIEEPETSQHPEHQKMLIEALVNLAGNCQILLTTHSPIIVQLLEKQSFNLIKKVDGNITVTNGKELLEKNKIALNRLAGSEISFLAFDYVSEEFHTELYSYIEKKKQEIFHKYIEHGAQTMDYIRVKDGGCVQEKITLHKYIRHQIHHPENDKNPRYTSEQLKQSIGEMRGYLLTAASGR